MKEREYKYLIDQETFNLFLQWYINSYDYETDTKTNYYYDTKDFLLHKNNITCRVVHCRNQLYIQEKKAIKFRTFIKSLESDKLILESVPDVVYLSKLNCNAFLLGRLETKRHTIHSNRYIKIMFDENHYLGCTDYEIEVEYTRGHSRKDIKKIHDSLVNTKVSQKSKYTRFLEELNRENNSHCKNY